MSTGRKVSIVVVVGLWSILLYVIVWGIALIFADPSPGIEVEFSGKIASRWYDVFLFSIFNMTIVSIAVCVGNRLKKREWYWVAFSFLVALVGSLCLQFLQLGTENIIFMLSKIYAYSTTFVFFIIVFLGIVRTSEDPLPVYIFIEYAFISLAFGLGLGIINGMPFGFFAMTLVSCFGAIGLCAGFIIATVVYFGIFVVFKFFLDVIIGIHRIVFGKAEK